MNTTLKDFYYHLYLYTPNPTYQINSPLITIALLITITNVVKIQQASMMLIICHHPPRHITGGLFSLQRGLDYIHKSLVKCTKCGETTKEHVGVCTGVTYPVNGSKVPAHICKKCKTCGRIAVIRMLPARTLPLTTGDQEAKVMTFECHDCFPLDYVFGKEWNATPLFGKKLRRVNLRSGNYTHLTSEGLEVSINDLSATFKLVEN